MKLKMDLLPLLAFLLFSLGKVQGQPFQIVLHPKTGMQLPAIQSFAWGNFGDYVFLFGGRTDGLHRRQPVFSFAASGNNTQVYLIHNRTFEVKSFSLSLLPVGIQEQLQSTNMQFSQQGKYLVLTGGYAYSATQANHITFPNLTVVDLEVLFTAFQQNANYGQAFRQISDQRMAVTGGHMVTMGERFFLAGGNRFDGRYNPMGGASYVQKYTNSIRSFNLNPADTLLTILDFQEWTDSLNLHRRDYNLTPFRAANGHTKFHIWSGVFQYGVDLPWLNVVEFDEDSFQVIPSFNQYLNQYHTANTVIYDSATQTNYTLFFGGIGQYQYQNGTLVRNDSVPFVKTVSCIERKSTGAMAEFELPIQMPGYQGASAEFIPATNLQGDEHSVFVLPPSIKDSILLGTIYGGISSTAPNIFFTNTGTQSSALGTWTDVWLKPGKATAIPVKEMSRVELDVFPNPFCQFLQVRVQEALKNDYSFSLLTMHGKKLELPPVKQDGNSFQFDFSHVNIQGVLFLEISSPKGKSLIKLIHNCN
ncbi:MAG: T9SS type A sorting domain-containing protein [Bacteroidetes bacterium]|nr:T9SS type A sorting domain-containing protein [Bacteroidota bacterium]